VNKALYIRKLEEARAQLAAAVRMHDEAGQFMPQMSPALRVATRGGIDRVINARQATVTRLALMLERAG
jgi:hypothetical protein